jgi:hypothetical protein
MGKSRHIRQKTLNRTWIQPITSLRANSPIMQNATAEGVFDAEETEQ